MNLTATSPSYLLCACGADPYVQTVSDPDGVVEIGEVENWEYTDRAYRCGCGLEHTELAIVAALYAHLDGAADDHGPCVPESERAWREPWLLTIGQEG